MTSVSTSPPRSSSWVPSSSRVTATRTQESRRSPGESGANPATGLFDLAGRLRAGGWQVPACALTGTAADIAVQRILVRLGMSQDMAALLLGDFRDAVAHLGKHPITVSLTKQEPDRVQLPVTQAAAASLFRLAQPNVYPIASRWLLPDSRSGPSSAGAAGCDADVVPGGYELIRAIRRPSSASVTSGVAARIWSPGWAGRGEVAAGVLAPVSGS
jgi:hypothetical protein